MRRFGMGVMPTVKVRARRSQFPRRGMGQDIDPSMGISQSDYESDQAPDPYGGVSTPTPAGGVSLATILPSVLAATPGIETGAAQIIKIGNGQKGAQLHPEGGEPCVMPPRLRN